MQCKKALYFKFFQPELEDEVDATTQAIFDSGNEVGELARKHFGTGVLIDFPPQQANEAATETTAQIAKGEKTIFEASFIGEGISCKVDILHCSNPPANWQLIEVKQSVETKEEHIIDVAIQAVVLKQAGIKVGRYQLMHLNRECLFPDLENLFVSDDISEQVLQIFDEVESEIKNLIPITQSKIAPPVGIGEHCDSPYPCPFKAHCWKDFPDYSVLDLPGMSKKGWENYHQGKKLIADLNADDFKGKVSRAINATKSNEIFVERKVIRSELKNWQWPLYFLDFETINPAIPRYAKTSPYTQVPFQFSCHVWPAANKKLQHFEFLHTESSDPRPFVAAALAEGIGSKGSIVSYSKGFEAGVMKKLAAQSPKHREKLLHIIDRLVDPLPLFREYVYHREFRGSFSIKAVAPALLGARLKYDDLEVSHGQQAQVVVAQLMSGQVPEAERERLRQSLLAYCRQDTLAMVELVKWLRGI